MRSTRVAHSLLVAVAWVSGSCTPTEILEERFQAESQTCYEFPVALDAGGVPQSSFRTETYRRPGCEVEPGAGGMVSDPSSGGTGGASAGAPTVANGGSAPDPSGGAAGTPTGEGGSAAQGGSGNATPQGGGAGAGGGGDVGTGGTGDVGDPPWPAGCSEERVNQLFKAQLDVGGCQDTEYGGCHGDGPDKDNTLVDTRPDLTSPNLRAELLGGSEPPSEGGGECGTQWITAGGGLEGSLLWAKVSSPVPNPDLCGDPMPPPDIPTDRVVPEELECLRVWILRVANGH